jgi:hypothetical protein
MVRFACACLSLFFVLAAPMVRAADLASRPPDTVDVALVLAVDVSGSIDEARYDLQRRGFAEAFRSRAVLDAIQSGEHQSIAVTLVEWSGKDHQRQMIGWTRIGDADAALRFADALERSPRAFADWTAIGAAIDFSVGLFDSLGRPAERRVIDVSGDGASNNGRPAKAARDDAIARGVVINGLPILVDDKELEAYYGEHVIGGDGAFTVPAEDFDSFSRSVLGKLVREIAGREVAPFSVAALSASR